MKMLFNKVRAALVAALILFVPVADAASTLNTRIGVAIGDSYTLAFNSSTATLEAWFQANTGPRVPIVSFYSGTYEVNTQADASALTGKRVTGRINVNCACNLADFEVIGIPAVGLSTHYNLINILVSNVTVGYFFADGVDERAYSGFGGTGYRTNIYLHHGEIVRTGDDGGKGFTSSRYEYLYIYDQRDWDTGTDGVYNLAANNIQYPHSDSIQFFRPFNTIFRCWLKNGVSDQAISASLWNDDVLVDMTGIIIRQSFIGGGSVYSIHAANTGTSHPSGQIISGNLFSRSYGGYPGNPPISLNGVPASAIDITGNVWEDTRTPIPAAN